MLPTVNGHPNPSIKVFWPLFKVRGMKMLWRLKRAQRMNHTCWSLQPHHLWLVTLLALTSPCVAVQAVDSDQPWTHRKWEAVWMLQAAKRQSQAAGKALACSQSAFCGWMSIRRKWWKYCGWCCPGKHLNLFKGPTGSNTLAQVKSHQTPQTDLFFFFFLNRSIFSQWPFWKEIASIQYSLQNLPGLSGGQSLSSESLATKAASVLISAGLTETELLFAPLNRLN